METKQNKATEKVVDTLEEVKEDVLLEKTEKKSEVEVLKEKLKTLINEKRELVYPKVVLAKSEVLDILKDIVALL